MTETAARVAMCAQEGQFAFSALVLAQVACLARLIATADVCIFNRMTMTAALVAMSAGKTLWAAKMARANHAPLRPWRFAMVCAQTPMMTNITVAHAATDAHGLRFAGLGPAPGIALQERLCAAHIAMICRPILRTAEPAILVAG